MADRPDEVQHQYLAARYVPERLAAEGEGLLACDWPRLSVLALLAGAFVTLGALLSVLVASGVEAEGPRLVLAGIGFSVGYYFVALAGVALFTEANVALPDVLLARGRLPRHLLRFWGLVFVFNFAGAYLVGWMVAAAQQYSPDFHATLREMVDLKMAYRARGDAGAWWGVVLSGALANWMVGLAFFFAKMAQTVLGKFLPLALAVILFEAANFQHSPANMGYFSLIMPLGEGPGWAPAVLWNILPAAGGNVLGGALLVALPFWYAIRARSPDR
ncbi:MAG: formate/nitrite transporter family protein [Actinobacteria bacterium]|nr:formate/nitrite transporter family protein [Actinomycetota bacterium]